MPGMGCRFLSFALLFVFLLNENVFAQTPAQTDVQALKTEIDALKANYEKRLQALEEKLSVLKLTRIRPWRCMNPSLRSKRLSILMPGRISFYHSARPE